MSVTGTAERRDFGADLDAALTASSDVYRWDDPRRTARVLVDTLA